MAERCMVDRKWEVQNALDTLRRAEEIRGDRALMKDVKKAAVQAVKAVGASPPRSSVSMKRKK